MIIKNVKVYTEDEIFTDGMVVIRDGRFDQVLTDAGKVKAAADMRDAADLWSTDGECFDDEVIDGEGAYAIPGLIDIHFHGCKGYDFCDGTKEAIAGNCEIRSVDRCDGDLSGYYDASGG